jgi:hypothetical protein
MKKAEEDLGKVKLGATPQIVSSSSSIHPVQGEVGGVQEEQEVDMMAGIRSDFVRQTQQVTFLLLIVVTGNHQEHI